MTDVELRCRCGQVHGTLRDVSPASVNRTVCYCDDCQAFLHWLDRADLLDGLGGTDIVQVAPSSLAFDRGREQFSGMRLSGKGMFRFYARCCNTPLGNTLRPFMPFIGIPDAVLRGTKKFDEVFGPPRARILGKFAIGANPDSSPLTTARMIAHAAGRLLAWKAGGKTWPHPFFDRDTGKPRPAVKVLDQAERDALRPKCGPHPTA